MTLFHLFCIFFYIGLFAIGGGLVAATFMHQILVEQYALISNEKFFNMLAISESTPGPIGINLATYVGTELFGPGGGIITTLGEVLPSFIVIILIARFFAKFQEKPLVKDVFAVLRPATAGLVLVALFKVLLMVFITPGASALGLNPWQALLQTFDFKALWLYSVSLAFLFMTKIHPVFIIAACAVFGVIFL